MPSPKQPAAQKPRAPLPPKDRPKPARQHPSSPAWSGMSPDAAAAAEQMTIEETTPLVVVGGNDPLDESQPITPPSTPTSEPPTAEQVDSLAGLIGIIFMLIGRALHFFRTPGPNMVWIPTPLDVEDVGDVVGLIGASVGYGARSIEEERQIKQPPVDVQ
jgi:hypothetical protein